MINRDAQAENLQKRRETKAALLVFTALRAPEGLLVRAWAREARVEFCINHAISRGGGSTQTRTQTHAHTLAGRLHLSLIKILTPPTSSPKHIFYPFIN